MTRGHRLGLSWVLALASAVTSLQAKRLELVWPTPNRAFLEGKPIEAYVQPTVSGEVTSGLFGCVRSNGTQFHEGLDLAPVGRDSRGEPTDPIYAAMAGTVRYINRTVGDSSYGRYIILEHPGATPAIYTLYAHLATITPGLAEGETVKLGQVIATMGRSAGGYGIPKDRAHLHFEMGFRLTDDFESWYRWRKFGNPNEHSVWNGMNLVGFDALDFYTRFKNREVDDVADYLKLKQPKVVVRVAKAGVPDFLLRYPQLKETDGAFVVSPAGWEIAIDCQGLPFRWRPLDNSDLVGYRRNEVRVISVEEALQAKCHCKRLAVKKGARYTSGRDLLSLTQLLFGLR